MFNDCKLSNINHLQTFYKMNQTTNAETPRLWHSQKAVSVNSRFNNKM